MEHQVELILNEIAERFHSDIRFFEYNDFSEWLPGTHYIEANLTIAERQFSGCGISECRDIALKKSLFECLEHWVLKTTKASDTSSGIAIHHDVNSARTHSILELIERDIFLCHYLTKTPINSLLHIDKILDPFQHQKLTKQLKKINTEIQVGLLRSIENEIFVALAYADSTDHPKSFSAILGLGCSTDYKTAAKKSIYEVIQILAKVSKDQGNGISLKEFKSKKVVSPIDHLLLGLGSDYPTDHLKNLFTPTDSNKCENFRQIDSYEIDLSDFSKSTSLHCVVSNSNSLQKYFVGALTEKDININRLSEFSGKNLSFKKIEEIPHIFG